MAELAGKTKWIADRYELLKKLGEGSTGSVWLARDHIRNETIALRCIDEKVINDIGGFQEAAKLLTVTTNFRHPSVSSIFDFATSDGVVYMSMERQKGVVLREKLVEAKANPARHLKETTILDIVETVLNVMEVGSQTGWAHAGIKPENIWLRPDSAVCVSEYGLHNLLPPDALKSSAALLHNGNYLAPEMYELNESPCFQTDQFALGVLWTELLQSSDLRQLPGAFCRHRSIIQKLTETSPDDRFQDPGSLMNEFESIRNTRTLKPTGSRLKFFTNLLSNKQWKRWLIWAPALLLLLPLWQEFSYRVSTVVPSIATLSNLQRMTRELEAKRIRLFGDGFQHALLRPHLESLFINIYPIEAMLEVGGLTHGNTQGHLDNIQSKLESEFRRINKAQELVQLFSKLESWHHHLSQSNAIDWEETELWFDQLTASRESTLSAMQLGQLDVAVQKLNQFLEELQSHFKSVFAKEKLLASQQSARWSRLLGERGTPYAEPQENLTASLDHLEDADSGTELVAKIQEARHIQESFIAWSNDWESQPIAPANAFRNSLGMIFVPVGEIHVSVWETRVIDFYHFIADSGFDENRSWREEAELNSPAHPVSTIARYGAVKFCEWLTEKERALGVIPKEAFYALPSDLEWSQLAGLNAEQGDTPETRHFNAPSHLPWEGDPNDYSNHGNYFTPGSANESNQYFGAIDRFHRTAPVGQFEPNKFGLYDVGGNVMEWVSTEFKTQKAPYSKPLYTLRGGGWRTLHPEQMQIGYRIHPPAGLIESGFRCVLKNLPDRR